MIKIDNPDDFRQALSQLRTEGIAAANGRTVNVPCLQTILVRADMVVANTYNPNHVSSDKMALLQESICDNGFCFPVVTIWDDDVERFVVVDGFHRSLIGGSEWLGMEYLPVVVLEHDISRRMIATHQFNKARGVHEVDLDAEIIRALIEQGMGETDIAVKLGIDEDTVHRYKQITGVAELFKGSEYSIAWKMVDDE